MRTMQYNKEEEEIATVICPMCSSPEIKLLGKLGKLIWFRCVNCGIDFNQKSEE